MKLVRAFFNPPVSGSSVEGVALVVGTFTSLWAHTVHHAPSLSNHFSRRLVCLVVIEDVGTHSPWWTYIVISLCKKCEIKRRFNWFLLGIKSNRSDLPRPSFSWQCYLTFPFRPKHWEVMTSQKSCCQPGWSVCNNICSRLGKCVLMIGSPERSIALRSTVLMMTRQVKSYKLYLVCTKYTGIYFISIFSPWNVLLLCQNATLG